jgi:hypothetical protein
MNEWKNRPFFYPSLLFIVLYLVVFLLGLTQKIVLQQDGVFKYYQLLDLEKTSGWELAAIEKGMELDKPGKFARFQQPFQFQLGEKRFFVFPYTWTFLNFIQYKLFGFYGIFILPFLGGFLSVYFFSKFLETIEMEQYIISISLYFYVLSTPILIYSNWFYEASLCSAFLYFSYWVVLKKENVFYFVLAGFCLGLSFLLRQELVLFSYLFLFFLFFVHGKYRPRIIVVGLVSFLVVLFSVYCNKLIYGIYPPLRSLDMTNYSVVDRFLRVLDYLFLEHYSLLLYVPFIFMSLWIVKEEYSTNRKFSNEQISLCLSCWIFVLLLPLVAPNQQGSDLTPRYFFPIIPCLAFLSFKVISLKWDLIKKKWIPRFLVAYSALFILVMGATHIYFNRLVDKQMNLVIGQSKYINVFMDIFTAHTFITDREILSFRADNGYRLRELTSILQSQGFEDGIRIIKLKSMAVDFRGLEVSPIVEDFGLEILEVKTKE